mgnify:CR=1 FL=1|jgi:hypothetical protein|tara:strand:+ start:2342 stop:2812 length:471 start_codon:yes stop_codon:yes gene_type:complete
MGKQTQIEATLYWPNLATVNDMSGKYQVDLGELDKSAVKALESLGVDIKTDPRKNKDYPDRKLFVTGKSKFPIKVAFRKGVEEVDPGEIGNGTKAKVRLVAYEWNFKGKEGIGVGVNKVFVTDLAKYVTDEDDDDDWGEDDYDDLGDVLDSDFEDN